MASKKIGIQLPEGWKVTKTSREKNKTTYIITNEDTLEEVEVFSHTLKRWLRNPKLFDPHHLVLRRSKWDIPETDYKHVLNTISKPKFTSIEKEIQYCITKIRHVKKCEECLRYKTCDTLLKKYEEERIVQVSS